MSQVTVELEWEAVDSIVRQQLAESLESLRRDLDLRREGHGLAIFSHNASEDSAEIERHVKSFECVLSYFGHAE
jgi:hypothetical protein